MRLLVIVAALRFVSSSAVAAPAAVDESRAAAKEHFLKGTKAFDLGMYEDAIKEYMAAYQLRDDPAFLYNIAQAHRLAEHAPEALRFYKKYLSKLPEARNRDEVQLKIDELEKLVAQQKRTRELPPDHTIGSEPGNATPGATTTTTAPATTTPAASTTAQPAAGAGRGKKIAGIVVGVAGVALAVGGIVCGVLAKSAGDQLTQLDRSHQPFDPAKESAGKTDVILEGVLLGVGAAAVVVGVTLLVVGQGESSKRSRVALSPVLTPTAAGAALQVTF